MNKTTAISILTAHYDAAYQGTYVVPACSGNLIEDIMNEGDEGKTFHQWGTSPNKIVVEESSLIPLAKHYA